MGKKKNKEQLKDSVRSFFKKIRPIHSLLVVFVFVVLAVTLLMSQQEQQQITLNQNPTTSEKPEQSKITTISIPTPGLYPQKRALADDPPFMSAKAVLAVDVDSSVVLFANNEHLPLWPASTTKVMTALVALEEYAQDEIVTVTNPVSDGSVMGLVEGERITVENLLYGMLIHSANDAAYALARHHRGGITKFVELMNQKAHTIRLDNTHFFDPAGFDNDKQYTTVSDLAKLTTFALQNKTIAHMVAIPAITVSDESFVYFHKLRNVNQLLGSMPGVAGVKTGYTENAKENLINLTKRDNHQVLTVILGSDDRFGETRNLTDWAFQNFEWMDFTGQSTSGQEPESLQENHGLLQAPTRAEDMVGIQ